MTIKETTIKEEVIKWRRQLHENPELGFEEVETSNYIYQLLQSFSDLEISRPTKTSVLAVLKGLKPSASPLTIAFRADIDALPIVEEADVPFKSKKEGVMHACGHDTHTAMLLGAAKVLSSKREEISGEIRFIFQHAEEVSPGGALGLVDVGVVDNVDHIFALHVDPFVKSGTITMKDDVLCAAIDDFEITIIGKGGHASMPEKSIDPIAIGAEVVSNLHQITARKISALNVPVLSVVVFQSGNVLNVIPETAYIGGTLRSLDSESREEAKKYVNQIVKGISEAHGASFKINWMEGYDPVINDKESVTISRKAATEVFGHENVIHIDKPFFGGEDFSAYLRKSPGSMQFLGIYNEELGNNYPLHHPKFMVDEEALQYGTEYFVKIAEHLCMK